MLNPPLDVHQGTPEHEDASNHRNAVHLIQRHGGNVPRFGGDESKLFRVTSDLQPRGGIDTRLNVVEKFPDGATEPLRACVHRRLEIVYCAGVDQVRTAFAFYSCVLINPNKTHLLLALCDCECRFCVGHEFGLYRCGLIEIVLCDNLFTSCGDLFGNRLARV